MLEWTNPQALAAEAAWHSPKWCEKVTPPAFRYRHQARQVPARFVTVVTPYQEQVVLQFHDLSVRVRIGDGGST